MSDSNSIAQSSEVSIQPRQSSISLSSLQQPQQSLGLSGVCHPKGRKVLVKSNYDGFFYPGKLVAS